MNINRNKILSFVGIMAAYITIVTFVLITLYERSVRWRLLIDQYANFSLLRLILFASFAATCCILLYALRNVIVSLFKTNAFKYTILIIVAAAGFCFKIQAVEYILLLYAVYAILFINQSLDENKLYQSTHKLSDYFLAGLFTIKGRMSALFVLLILLSLPLISILNKTAVTGDKFIREHDTFIEMTQRLKIKKVGLVIGGHDYDYSLSRCLGNLGVEVRPITSDIDLEWADAVYASNDKPKETKDWPTSGAMLINPRLKKIVFTQTFYFNDIKVAGLYPAYTEECQTWSFALLPGDLIEVEFVPSAPIPRETGAYFIFPQWQENNYLHTLVTTDGNPIKICIIGERRIEKSGMLWRNWGGIGVLPATKIIIKVWRQPTDPALAEASP